MDRIRLKCKQCRNRVWIYPRKVSYGRVLFKCPKCLSEGIFPIRYDRKYMFKKADSGIWIFFVFMILIIAVILTVIFIKGSSEVVVSKINSSINITYFNITLSSNAVSKISFKLSNGTKDFLSGSLYPNAIEEYKGIPENTSLLFSGWSNEYYYNVSNCFIVRNNMNCWLSLKFKANDYSIVLSKDSIWINPINGTIQRPIFCFSERSNVAFVSMNLSIVPVPNDLKTKVDFCYSVGADISSSIIFPIDIHLSQQYISPDLLTVMVRDFEEKGYSNIGDRTAVVTI